MRLIHSNGFPQTNKEPKRVAEESKACIDHFSVIILELYKSEILEHLLFHKKKYGIKTSGVSGF